MATHHPSPPGMNLHHGPPGPPGMAPGPQAQWPPGPIAQQVAAMNEAVWLQIGSIHLFLSL
jgi:glucose repression mediator protein